MGGSRAILDRKLENQEFFFKYLMKIGSQKKGVDRWGELYPNFFWMSGIFNTLQGLLGAGQNIHNVER